MQPGTPIKATGAKSNVSIAPGGEVLLTAGAIHSPHLLMASGVGPKSHLDSFNIDTVSDLSGVGQNLQACSRCTHQHPAGVQCSFMASIEATSHPYAARCTLAFTNIMCMQDHPAILTAYEFEEDAERQCVTDHIYNDKASIRPIQVRLLSISFQFCSALHCSCRLWQAAVQPCHISQVK